MGFRVWDWVLRVYLEVHLNLSGLGLHSTVDLGAELGAKVFLSPWGCMKGRA